MPQNKKRTGSSHSLKSKPAQEAKEKIKSAAAEAVKMIEELKRKYDKVDSETKKKIMVGLAGAAAGMAALIGWKKHRGKK